MKYLKFPQTRFFRRNKAAFALLMALSIPCLWAATPLEIDVNVEKSSEPGERFQFGTATNPEGDSITLDGQSFWFNDKRWTPVMGEFHFSRYPASEWLQELRKMKAGGIDIVATYVFWNHHEEIAGQWEWSGNKNLREFIELATKADLKVILRAGPWCHGEVRNGGLPDWVVAQGNVRSLDATFLKSVTELYQQIATQADGFLWKDGGPVIGVQFDNEYSGPAEYLLALKKTALSEGLDVPIYTKTGWPELATPLPFGEMIPLFGAYAEGFWDRETTSMPGNYRNGFHFSKLRTDANIANEAFGRREVEDVGDVAKYPYLTCEMGGGMMSSYHRRILIRPADVVSVALAKVGSGSVSPGYYMYHGGTNPAGRVTPLMEGIRTPTTNWNDMPMWNYDFQAPIGQFGQLRPHYFQLRPLHLFLKYFGSQLAGMGTFLPGIRPESNEDLETLRWSVRSNGETGFVFVNNYERGRSLPEHDGVQFSIQLSGAEDPLLFPSNPTAVPAGSYFFWPFNLALNAHHTLEWATAQPVASFVEGDMSIVCFAQNPGIPAVFKLTGSDEFQLEMGQVRTFGSIEIRLMSLEEAERFALEPATNLNPEDSAQVAFELERASGALRTLVVADKPQCVALAPVEADFRQAAIYRIQLPEDFDALADPLLKLHYVGDVARFYIDDELITDDFYNGNPLEIGLGRFANKQLANAVLRLEILPLQRASIEGMNPLIYLEDSVRPNLDGKSCICELQRVELVSNRGWTLSEKRDNQTN